MIIKENRPFVTVNNILAAQTKKALDIFAGFILNEQFDIIIEIGTHRGGLSEYIHHLNSNFISYDINPEFNVSKKKDINFRIGNCLVENTMREIEKLVTGKKALILCDGGKKDVEFKIYSKMIESGSFIMAHDYSNDEESYNLAMRESGWFSPAECKYEEIKDAIKENNLKESNYHDIFLSTFWCCYTKK